MNPEEMRIMNAAGYEEKRLAQFVGKPIIEPKYDGIRAQCYIMGDRPEDVDFYTRNGNRLNALDGLREEMSHYGRLFSPLVLDGEAIVKDEGFSEGAGLIRRKYEIAKNAQFVVFDIANMDVEETWTSRRDFLDGLLWSDTVFTSPYHHVTNDDGINYWFRQFLLQGYEGAMVKDSGSLYMNRRHWSWMKLKDKVTQDVQIEDAYEGQGKYVGTLGGFNCRTEEGGKVNVGGGFSDAERDEFWKIWTQTPEKLRGVYIETTGQLKTKKGSIRHPNYFRLRTDK